MIADNTSNFRSSASQREHPTDTDPKLNLTHTYVARPPTAPLQSLGGKGDPPYGQPANLAPRVIAPVASVRPGPQPVYHLKVTATPVHPLGDEPLRYEVSAGPTEIGEKDITYIGTDGKVVVHARKIDSAKGPKTISVKPTNAEILAEGLTADGQRHNIGAQTHVYSGAKALDPRIVLNRLQIPVAGHDARGGVDINKLKIGHRRESQRSIPSHRVSLANFADMEDREVRRNSGRSWWHFGKSRKESTLNGHSLHEDDDYARAMMEELDTGLQESRESIPGMPEEAVAMERGYSRLIPSLLQTSDDDRQRLYNWIVPQESAVEARSKMASAEAGGLPATEDAGPLYFQGSAQLANFLEAPGRGLMWEDESMEMIDGTEARNRAILKPSIVYGGVEHCPPEFAGRLDPLSFKLHAIELHQYVPVSGSDAPWFLNNGLSPYTQALYGPVPLPFDPANSGMPAPLFDTMTEAGQPMPRIAPLIRTFFNPELPVQYERKGELPRKENAAVRPESTSSEEEENVSSEEVGSRPPSSPGSSRKSRTSSSSGKSSILEGEQLKIPEQVGSQEQKRLKTKKSSSHSLPWTGPKLRSGSSKELQTPPMHPQMGMGITQGVSPSEMSAAKQNGYIRQSQSLERPSPHQPVTSPGADSPQVLVGMTETQSPNIGVPVGEIREAATAEEKTRQ